MTLLKWAVALSLLVLVLIYVVGNYQLAHPRPETNSEPVPPRLWVPSR